MTHVIRAGQKADAERIYGLDIALPFTPVIRGQTTDPSLGTGFTQEGWYHLLGGWVSGWATIVWGTGSTAGSGSFRVMPPVPPDMSWLDGTVLTGVGSVVGSGRLRDDSSALDNFSILVQLGDNQPLTMFGGIPQFWFSATGSNSSITSATIPWTTNDAISFFFEYPAAELRNE